MQVFMWESVRGCASQHCLQHQGVRNHLGASRQGYNYQLCCMAAVRINEQDIHLDLRLALKT